MFRPFAPIRQADRLAAAVATAAAIVLQVAVVSRAGALWRDEVNTVVVASSTTLDGLWQLLHFDSYPVLWPLLLRAWITIAGDSDAALRLAGLASGLSVPAAFWAASRMLRFRPPALALAMLAVNPVLLAWGTSARAWGVGTALVVLAWAGIWRAAHAPTGRRLALAALLATLAVQCLYQNAMLLAAIGAALAVAGVVHRRWSFVGAPVLAGGVAAISLVPYGPIIAGTAGWAPLNVVDIAALNVFARSLMALGPLPPVVLTVWLGTLGMLLFARGARPAAWTASAALVALAPLTLIAFYAAFDYPANPWYFLGLAGLLAAQTEALIATRPESLPARLAPALALVIVVAGAWPAWVAARAPLSNMDAVGAALAAQQSDGDLVIASPWLYGISLRRYAPDADDVVTVPPLSDFSVHRFDLLQDAVERADALAPLLARAQATLEGGRRVWIVGDLPPAGSSPARPGPPPLPDTGYRVLPYIDAWTDELMTFLEAHAVEARQVAVPREAQPLENARLAWFLGWRD